MAFNKKMVYLVMNNPIKVHSNYPELWDPLMSRFNIPMTIGPRYNKNYKILFCGLIIGNIKEDQVEYMTFSGTLVKIPKRNIAHKLFKLKLPIETIDFLFKIAETNRALFTKRLPSGEVLSYIRNTKEATLDNEDSQLYWQFMSKKSVVTMWRKRIPKVSLTNIVFFSKERYKQNIEKLNRLKSITN